MFVVVLAGLQAVVELVEEFVNRCGLVVPVSGGAGRRLPGAGF